MVRGLQTPRGPSLETSSSMKPSAVAPRFHAGQRHSQQRAAQSTGAATHAWRPAAPPCSTALYCNTRVAAPSSSLQHRLLVEHPAARLSTAAQRRGAPPWPSRRARRRPWVAARAPRTRRRRARPSRPR
eukprot:7232228-Prymnesium_polylepis.1